VEGQVARRRIAGMAGNIITIRGRKVIAGVAEGEAIVSKGPVMGLNNFNPRLGIITERDHPLRGIPLTGKVFVFPTPRGSGGWVNEERRVVMFLRDLFNIGMLSMQLGTTNELAVPGTANMGGAACLRSRTTLA
jgi:hypothetical protein